MVKYGLNFTKIENWVNQCLKVVSATFLLVCFLLCLNESTCETKKNVLFFLQKLFSWENQILEFYIFKYHDVIKCSSIKQVIHFTE